MKNDVNLIRDQTFFKYYDERIKELGKPISLDTRLEKDLYNKTLSSNNSITQNLFNILLKTYLIDNYISFDIDYNRIGMFDIYSTKATLEEIPKEIITYMNSNYLIKKIYCRREESRKFRNTFSVRMNFLFEFARFCRYKDYYVHESKTLALRTNNSQQINFIIFPLSELRKPTNNPLLIQESVIQQATLPSIEKVIDTVTKPEIKVDDRVKEGCYRFFDNYLNYSDSIEYILNKQVKRAYECVDISVTCKQLFYYLEQWYLTKGKRLILKSNNDSQELFDYKTPAVRNEPYMVITVELIDKQIVEPIKQEPIFKPIIPPIIKSVEPMQIIQEVKTVSSVSVPESKLTFTELTQLLKDMDEEIKSLMFKRRHIKDQLIKLLSDD